MGHSYCRICTENNLSVAQRFQVQLVGRATSATQVEKLVGLQFQWPGCWLLPPCICRYIRRPQKHTVCSVGLIVRVNPTPAVPGLQSLAAARGWSCCSICRQVKTALLRPQ
jgi:hypothetical protein